MGDFYLNGGDFKSAAIDVFIIDILLLLTFIGAQIVKGADNKFGRALFFERLLIFLCPFAFLWAMLPYNHFWTVYQQRDQIEKQFNVSVAGAKDMFTNYDEYSKNRLHSYAVVLDEIIANKATDNATYVESGFTGRNDAFQKGNFLHTLKLQLLSQNTDSLKSVATKWIDKSNRDASVWNAFLIGNIQQISGAIQSWHNTLRGYSEPILSNEMERANNLTSFDENGESIKAAMAGIESLKAIYTKPGGVQLTTIFSGIILFLLLLFPYFLQDRNTKARGYYSLFHGKRAKSRPYDSIDDPHDRHKTKKQPDDDNNGYWNGTF